MTAKVLIVEDDDLIREVMDTALTMAGFQCAGASRGEIAVEVLRTVRFDAVVLDISMPRMSGLEVLNWMRRRKMETPVLIVTANRSVDTVREAMAIGCQGYLAKPFAPPVLVERVRRLLVPPAADGAYLSLED